MYLVFTFSGTLVQMEQLFLILREIINLFVFLSMEALGSQKHENIVSSKWRSVNLAINTSPVNDSRNLIMEAKLYPTYIPKQHWGPIFMLYGGAINTCTVHPKICKYEMSKS